MAAYGSVGVVPRIVVLILLIAVLLFGGALWFDFLGLIDVKDSLSPILGLVGIQTPKPLEDAGAPALLDQERLDKLGEALDLREQDLKVREAEVEAREREIEQKVAALEEQERAFQDREKSFNEQVRLYDNKRANLEQNSQYLVGMPPQQAVQILLRMEDQDVIDVLRVTEQRASAAGEDSIVSYWMSLMPPERAATLQRKMALKPDV